MVLKVFLFHDLPSRLSDAFECKFSTVKFKSKVGKDEVWLAALTHSGSALSHGEMQLRLRAFAEHELGKGWILEEGSDNYGLLEKNGEKGVIEFFSHSNVKKVNALVQAFSKVLPNLPETTKVKVPSGNGKNEAGFLKTLEQMLEKKADAKIVHDRFPHTF